MKRLSEVTDQQCYDIAVLEGWKRLWERDRDVPEEELIQRGRDIIDAEIGGDWVNYERVNGYLTKHGYECLNAL